MQICKNIWPTNLGVDVYKGSMFFFVVGGGEEFQMSKKYSYCLKNAM